jgi:5-deoxy-glucuronate isomerase
MMTPKNTPLKALSCGRIILNKKVNRVSANTKGREVCLIGLKGQGTVTIDGRQYSMKPYDTLYIPPGMTYEVTTNEMVDIVESSAPTKKAGEVIYIPIEKIKADPKLHMNAGKETYKREIHKTIDLNIPADRLLCGVTFSAPGNWTSWPPHEHGKSKEEVYLYIDIPKPGFGIQMMYDDMKKPYVLDAVFEDDAVIITKGYHPNVAAPGFGMNFVWMMAALDPKVDRDWDIMNWQKEFAGKY